MLDVAIVGGGPAGLHLAARCAKAGYEVVVLEEHDVIGEPVHCTGVVSIETMEFAKIPDEMVLARLQAARLVSPGKKSCEITWEAAAREPIVAIDRSAFDRSLAAEALAAGAVVTTGRRVDAVHLDAKGVELHASGHRVRARSCVLACGVSYRLHRQLDLGLPASVLHSAQAELDALPSDTVDLYFGRRVAPEGFIWSVPLKRGGRSRLKVGIMARGDAGAYLKEFLARPEIRDRLVANPGPLTRRLLPLRPIPKTYAARLLVVGDAGGFAKPTTGGGIFYGLLTASLASDTLVDALRTDRLDEDTLEVYERRWQERLGRELRLAEWLRHVLTRCTDEEVDRLVVAMATKDVQSVLGRSARFNWHAEAIVALLKRPVIASIVARALFR